MNYYYKSTQKEGLPNSLNQWLALLFRLVNIYFLYTEVMFIWNNRNDTKILIGVIPIHVLFVIPSILFQISAKIRASTKFRSRMIMFGSFSILLFLVNWLLVYLYRDTVIEVIYVFAMSFYILENALLNGSLLLAVFFLEKEELALIRLQDGQMMWLQPKFVAVPYQYQNLRTEMI